MKLFEGDMNKAQELPAKNYSGKFFFKSFLQAKKGRNNNILVKYVGLFTILDGITNMEIRGYGVIKKVVMYGNILGAWGSKCRAPLRL